MDNNRPTKELKTKSGIDIILKQWITGREQEYIQEPIFEAASIKAGITPQGPTTELKEFKSSAITESFHRTIEKVLVSVDGKTENVLDLVLELPADDYNEIVEAVNDVVKKKA
jgi:hypothetical protein